MAVNSLSDWMRKYYCDQLGYPYSVNKSLQDLQYEFFANPPSGGAGGLTDYTHLQTIDNTVWTINHTLGYHPAGVKVFVSGIPGESTADVSYITFNQLTLTFDISCQGTAYLS